MNESTRQTVNAFARQVGDKVFYIPHFGDKRTRAYGMSPIGHMSGKEAKDVTKMVDAPYNEYQAYNNIGKYMTVNAVIDGKDVNIDKWTTASRTAYVYKVEADIMRHGANPVDTIEDWAGADEPNRYISAAMGIYKAQSTGVDGTVIPSDGSCSGIQHLSAGIKNRALAESVNLTSNPVRQDIYLDVRDFINNKFNSFEAVRDFAKEEIEDEDVQKAFNIIKAGGITRKATKTSTMTLSYGSAVSTTIKNVKAELIKAGIITAEDKVVGNLLGVIVEDGRKAVAGGAMGAMAFLKKIAKATNKNDVPVQWSTAKGLVLHNVKYLVDSSKTRILGGEQLNTYHVSKELDKGGMIAGISPNVVHSFDALHLHNTVNAAAREGIQVVTIHDSFGTTSNKVERLNAILREEFIKIYENKNIFIDILNSNKENIDPETFKELQEQAIELIVGDFDINEIAFNEFAFS